LEQEQRKGGQDDLIVYTLEMMLHDVTGSREPKRLTRMLVKQIFKAYGETELAENDELVEEMLQQAGALDSESRVMLDPDTFCRALTHDVQGYRVETKGKLSTNYQDAFMSDESNTAIGIAWVDAVDEEANKAKTNVPTVYTAPSLDGAADTFRSRPLVVFQWIFFVLSFQTYLIRRLNIDLLYECDDFGYNNDWMENSGVFGCVFGLSIAKWLYIMVVMSVVGLVFMGITGIGNFVECTNPIYPFVGMLVSLVFTLVPPWLFGVRTEDTAPTDGAPQFFLELVTYCLGGCVVLLNFWHFISLSIPKACRFWSWLQNVLVPEAIRSETRNKQAAAHKIDTMVKNALKIHREKKQETVVPTHFGQALLNFAETPPKYTHTGGFFWTWRMIFSRNLFLREGINFSGRLLSINFTQFVLTIFVLIGGIMITWVATDEFEQQMKRAQDFVDTLDLPEEADINVRVWFPLEEYM
jgi:hypothetical protein